jgi:prepilin-type N-terminal cleavage/methylation domain-containing protein
MEVIMTAKNSERGFTLFEQLIVMFLIGIFASLSSPSLIRMYQRAKINDAANTLRGAVQEAQRQAMMRSKNCTIFLPVTNTKDPNITGDCLITGDRLLKDVNLRHNYASKNNKIVFNYRGESNGLGTMVIDKQAEKINYQKCLVISNFIGMSRSGIYDSAQPTETSATYCQTIQ